ncbi:hypothetical protein [Burkholderia cepacia]|uniref:hypothetical protein n=1 Tax=Burkholderia cepacia TaxID=292 RepID=UPI0022AA8FA6|nr:hypothetical protein [Burkholderia cepacia]
MNNRAENSHQPTRAREKVTRRLESARQLQRFASAHGQASNLFMGAATIAACNANARRMPKPSWPGKGLHAPACRRKLIGTHLSRPFV